MVIGLVEVDPVFLAALVIVRWQHGFDSIEWIQQRQRVFFLRLQRLVEPINVTLLDLVNRLVTLEIVERVLQDRVSDIEHGDVKKETGGSFALGSIQRHLQAQLTGIHFDLRLQILRQAGQDILHCPHVAQRE